MLTTDITFPSVVQELDAADYHAFPALNSSTISALLQCPAAAQAVLDGEGFEETAAMRLGTLVHARVLEPKTVSERYAVLSQSATTKAGKAEKQAALDAGKVIVSQADWEKAHAMHAAVFAHRKMASLLRRQKLTELSFFWETETPLGAVKCKGRADALVENDDGSVVVVDLKTAQTVDPSALSRKVHDFGYHRQAAWYLSGLEANEIFCSAFVFIFVQSSPPYLVTPVILSQTALDRGRQDCELAANLWAQCQSEDSWPDYTNGNIIEIDLPMWAYR